MFLVTWNTNLITLFSPNLLFTTVINHNIKLSRCKIFTLIFAWVFDCQLFPSSHFILLLCILPITQNMQIACLTTMAPVKSLWHLAEGCIPSYYTNKPYLSCIWSVIYQGSFTWKGTLNLYFNQHIQKVLCMLMLCLIRLCWMVTSFKLQLQLLIKSHIIHAVGRRTNRYHVCHYMGNFDWDTYSKMGYKFNNNQGKHHRNFLQKIICFLSRCIVQ